MVKTLSKMLALGTVAPDFKLPATDGKLVSLRDYASADAKLIMFICNHCPFVKHISAELAKIGRDFSTKAVAILAINSNDYLAYPDDRPERMREEKTRLGYNFPYLLDESQEVAKAYQAACTPDFFVFDKNSRLVYRGQLDDSRPGNGVPVTGNDLRKALNAVLNHEPLEPQQKPSLGCNIKWKTS